MGKEPYFGQDSGSDTEAPERSKAPAQDKKPFGSLETKSILVDVEPGTSPNRTTDRADVQIGTAHVSARTTSESSHLVDARRKPARCQRPARWGPVCCVFYKRNIVQDNTGAQVR